MPDNRNDLYSILGDLWGSTDALAAENARRLNELTKELQAAGSLDVTANALATEAPAQTAPAASAQPEEEKKEEPKQPTFEDFWKLADEVVDWTDALSYEEPKDSGVDPEMWAFFHEQAEKVLQGDVSAYLAVMKKANPLGDLRPYARSFNVHADSADRMTVSFEGLEQYLTGEGADAHRYLAGIALRTARDLMALLPVREVAVTANASAVPTLEVTFTRTALQRIRFSFTDPVELVTACGGVFTEE